RKYEKLGWSDTKIRRALRQAMEAAEKHGRSTGGLRDDVTRALVSICQGVGSVAVWVHVYEGDVDAECVAVKHSLACAGHSLAIQASRLRGDELLIAHAG